MSGGARGLQNRCGAASQSRVGSTPTHSRHRLSPGFAGGRRPCLRRQATVMQHRSVGSRPAPSPPALGEGGGEGPRTVLRRLLAARRPDPLTLTPRQSGLVGEPRAALDSPRRGDTPRGGGEGIRGPAPSLAVWPGRRAEGCPRLSSTRGYPAGRGRGNPRAAPRDNPPPGADQGAPSDTQARTIRQYSREPDHKPRPRRARPDPLLLAGC